jgi:O-succinylbenzoic acid--CoA ligase
VLTRPSFDPEEASALIEGGPVTHLSLVPVMLDRLLEIRGDRPVPSTLRCVLLGGDRLPRTLLDRAISLGYPIAVTYGMTEATSQIATATPDEVRKRPEGVGRAIQGVDVRIEDPDSEGTGEILVRGPTIVEGLPVRERRTTTAGPSGRGVAPIDPSPSVFIDDEGWLHTGDLGRMDAEGTLEVVGRLTDRIVTAGVTVEPAEVEEVLSRHPKVLKVVVVGVPDEVWGERILAGVVPRDVADPPSLEELLAFTRGRLAPAKRPRELRLLVDLPRNDRGKVVRSRLADG